MRLLAAAALCVVAEMGAVTCAARNEVQTSPVPASTVSEIALERRCFGCDREMKLTLRRDGTATKVLFGNARQGTVDRQMTATLAVGAFEALAAALGAEGFFGLRDEYTDPALADGESLTTSAKSGDRLKSVLERNGKGPAALKRVQSRIEELGNTLAWKATSNFEL